MIGVPIAIQTRKIFANLDDKDLSKHLTTVVFKGGAGTLTTIAYVSMKGSTCIITNINFGRYEEKHGYSDIISDNCSGLIDPLLGVGIHLSVLFAYQVVFSPFFDFDLTDLMRFTIHPIYKFTVIMTGFTTAMALYLFGQQRRGEPTAYLAGWIVTYLWEVWLVVCIVNVVFQLRKRLFSSRERSKRRGGTMIRRYDDSGGEGASSRVIAGIEEFNDDVGAEEGMGEEGDGVVIEKPTLDILAAAHGGGEDALTMVGEEEKERVNSVPMWNRRLGDKGKEAEGAEANNIMGGEGNGMFAGLY